MVEFEWFGIGQLIAVNTIYKGPRQYIVLQ